jgi:hypothetical protein
LNTPPNLPLLPPAVRLPLSAAALAVVADVTVTSTPSNFFLVMMLTTPAIV